MLSTRLVNIIKQYKLILLAIYPNKKPHNLHQTAQVIYNYIIRP